MLAGSDFNVVSGNEAIADEAENGLIYFSALPSPPKRQESTRTPTSVDPWSAGSDTWRRNIVSDVVDRFRHVESPVLSTASFSDRYRAPPSPSSASIATRALFSSPEALIDSSASSPPRASGRASAVDTRYIHETLDLRREAADVSSPLCVRVPARLR